MNGPCPSLPMGKPSHRDPTALLAATRHSWGGRSDLWVFGYASLIWRPEFEAAESHPAVVHGWHRALKMRSHINRGTPDCPGLVFALVRGGCCRGMVYRIEQGRAEAELERLWQREMPNAVYDPTWLQCRTPHGKVCALGFTLHPRSPSHVPHMSDETLAQVFRTARGRYGTTREYVLETAASLQRCGIRDRELERVAALARRHPL